MAGQNKQSSAVPIIQRFLIFVGKPFYFILSSLFILILYLFSFLKNLIGKLKHPKLILRLVLFAGLVIFIWYYIFRGLPSPQTLVSRQQEVSTKIYDRNGELLYKIYKNKNRTPISLTDISKQVELATLAAEDAEFYTHIGFSIKGILRAIVKNIKKGELAGGSTITQQLVKNALLSPEKTLARKIKELILAIEVEIVYSKQEILEMYLNEVSYGGTAYGIQEAARVYFGKDVGKIDLAEAALLAGLPKAPSRYSPFGFDPALSKARQKEVLDLMVANFYISKEDALAAGNEKLIFASNHTQIKAPHFVMYVRNLLAEKYGEEVVEKGGLEVTTTLDLGIQTMAEQAVADEVGKLSGYNVGNGAALVVNPKNGQILAMVGSKNYFDTKNDGNVNVTTALRQPGSSIKVINYAYALGHGFTPASIIDDSAVSFRVPGQETYSPKNYDGNYRGRISLRSAFAESRNIPAVKILASYGVVKMIDQGVKMGITSWKNPSQFGLSLTLGGGEVKLIDLARAYATVANYGRINEFNPILKITNYKGRVLEENGCASMEPCGQEQVLDERIAFQIIDILKDNTARTPAFGVNSSLVISGHPEVAVKTGTSNNLKDNLTFGFNRNFLVAVWVGNNNGKPMAKIASGITGAAPIFNRIMRSLLKDEPAVEWEIPSNMKRVQICSLTGTLPCQNCPSRYEWFLAETVPQKACVFQAVSKEKIPEPAVSTEN